MSFELLQMHKGLLKALLRDVFRVGLIASESQSDTQHLGPIKADENFKRLAVSVFGRDDKRLVSCGQVIEQDNPWLHFLNLVHDCDYHRCAPLAC
jgi:hypothetical protein